WVVVVGVDVSDQFAAAVQFAGGDDGGGDPVGVAAQRRRSQDHSLRTSASALFSSKCSGMVGDWLVGWLAGWLVAMQSLVKTKVLVMDSKDDIQKTTKFSVNKNFKRYAH